MTKLILPVILCFLSLSGFSRVLEAKSPYVKRQVKFWEKIYTEVSVHETVLHDKHEPSIVYKVVPHRNHNHTQRVRTVRRELRKLRNILKNIQKKKLKNLSTKEKEVLAQIPTKYRKNFSKRVWGLRYQQGMKEKFKDGIGRSYLYLSHIENALKKYNVPKELIYLPHVESSFNYNAYSKVGAAGIWQFMRSSGRYYKLKIGKVVDERLDPIKATKAAARMLRDNYRILKSWPLAVTAYNHGPGSMRRAVRTVGTKNFDTIIKKYKRKSFGFPSKNFYASFLAAIKVAEDYMHYYRKIEAQARLSFETVQMKKSYRVKTIMKKYGLSKKTFRFYNPHIKKSALRWNKVVPRGTTIRLPINHNIAATDNLKKNKLDV